MTWIEEQRRRVEVVVEHAPGPWVATVATIVDIHEHPGEMTCLDGLRGNLFAVDGMPLPVAALMASSSPMEWFAVLEVLDALKVFRGAPGWKRVSALGAVFRALNELEKLP